MPKALSYQVASRTEVAPTFGRDPQAALGRESRRSLIANRQLIAKFGGSFFRHLITPTNGGRNRHIRRQLVSVPPCTGRRERPRGVASEVGR